MTFITDFADQAVILPLVLAIGIALLAQGWRRGAAAWALAVVATFAAMLALKLVFLACSAQLRHRRHPHAERPCRRRHRRRRRSRRAAVAPARQPCCALAALAAIVIGISRLALGAAFAAGGGDRRGAWAWPGALALLLLAGRRRRASMRDASR